VSVNSHGQCKTASKQRLIKPRVPGQHKPASCHS